MSTQARRRTHTWRKGLILLISTTVVACTAQPTPPPDPARATQATATPAATTPETATSETATQAVSTPAKLPLTPRTKPAQLAPTPASTAPRPTACPLPQTGFDCDFQRRIVAVQAYLQTRPGTVGIVVRDRHTGAQWHNQYANTRVWTASTIKLAMVVDLYTRQAQGLLTLSHTDRSEIQAMLHSSDDDAADALWFRYAGANHFAYNNRFARYGLTALQPEAGFTNYFPYWGFQECTPADLDRLMQYVLTKLPSDERNYIVTQLQHVDPDQQWGVWGAGPAAAPGNKDGWSQEQSGWVMNSVGFVGPGQRYTLAVMNSLNGKGDYDDGRTTDSAVSRMLFAGRF